MAFRSRLWVVAGVVTTLILGAVSAFVLSAIEHQRRSEARDAAHVFSLRLLDRFNETLGALYLLAASVDRQSGTISRFDDHAADLMRDFPLLRALELAPGGVIKHVYPMRGNETVIGHDLLTDKTRNREVHLAVSRRQMAIAGPMALRQGGIGVVARYPLHHFSSDGRSRFWGMAIAVVDFPSLLRAAGESEFERLGYHYQICWVPSGDTGCKQIIGDPDLSPDTAVVSKLGVGLAEWRLLVQPRHSWLSMVEYAVAALLAFLGGGLAGWLAYRLAQRPA